MLSSIMKEKPKVKKRRLSDIKAEKEAKVLKKKKLFVDFHYWLKGFLIQNSLNERK